MLFAFFSAQIAASAQSEISKMVVDTMALNPAAVTGSFSVTAQMAPRALVVVSAQEIAEKNWTRKEVCQRSEDLIREALNDDTGW